VADEEPEEPGFSETGLVPNEVVIPLGEFADNETLPVRPRL